MRRSQRNIDPFQTNSGLTDLLGKMKTLIYPAGVIHQDFKKLLFAIQYFERHPAKESKIGRKARFDSDFLFNSALKLKSVLQNETGGRISLLRFISTYLPIPDYPRDIQTALDQYKINLEEARILSRINRKTLGLAENRQPNEIRKELIDSHIKRQGTQNELRKRVQERLNLTPKRQVEQLATHVAIIDSGFDEQLEFNEFDTEHLLWEEIKSLVYLMRGVDTTQVDEETTEQLLSELDAIKLKLMKFTIKPDLEFHLQTS